MNKPNIGCPVWSQDKVYLTLANAVARAAVAGRPSPIAARVLERIELAQDIAKHMSP